MSERLLEVDGVSKEDRLGQISSGRLRDDQARVRLRGRGGPQHQAGRGLDLELSGAFLALDDVRLA